MIYVALLRGINVGGKSLVSMASLKEIFESLGFTNVKTYINSGNIIFISKDGAERALATRIEQGIAKACKLDVEVLVKSHPAITQLAQDVPSDWVNDNTMKCDVLFLWPEVDEPAVLEQLPIRPELEDVRYLPGAVIWRVDHVNQTKSRLTRIVGTPLYQQLTIRNINTLRKILILMDVAAEQVA